MPISKIHPNEMEQLMLFAEEASQEGGTITTQLTCLTKAGTVIPAEISANYGTDNQGRSLMIAQVRDISKRLAAEEARRELEETLYHAQKMDAVGQLAGGIAHDFNNILTVINGYSAELAKRDDMAAVKEDLEAILLAGQRGSELTKQLLTFSRKQETEARVIDLKESIPTARKLWQRTIGADIDLQVNFCPEDCFILIEPGQFDQVLMNLVVNARDAMPDGGKITIDVELVRSPVLTFLSGPCVKINVTDTGSGIDKATQERIFEPFFTTKDQGKGTGLGLATVYAIIDRHDGHLSVASEVGEGTCFTIHLPLAAGKPEEARPEEKVKAPASPATGTILVVEDEPAVLKLVVISLERAGYEVLQATDGESGAAFAASHTGPIDLLITDMVMPNAGGPAMAEAFTEQYEDAAILFISGYADSDMGGAELLATHGPILGKPFTQSELLEAVAKKLEPRATSLRS